MNQTVLITGCSDGGLGASLASVMHKGGDYKVFATARNPEKMASLQAIGIMTLSLDVSSDASVAACASELSKLTGGSLDILVNNAGAGYNMPLLDVDLAEFSKQFDLNVLSVLRVTRGFVDLLRHSNRPHGALLVNNTSMVSTLPMPFQGPYSASKAAAGSMTECLRLELQMFNIQVIDLKTGLCKSGFFDNVHAPRLPADSYYAKQRDLVEKRLKDGPTGTAITADEWAEQVAKDLSYAQPSPVIYRGGGAFLGRIASSIPIGLGFKDNFIKDISGLKELETAWQEA